MILTISGFFSAGGIEPVYALRNPLTADMSDTIAVYTYLKGIRMAEYGYAAAIGLAQSLMSLILLFLVNNNAKKIFKYSLF
jgi:putative aldouronate transport system permease protein